MGRPHRSQYESSSLEDLDATTANVNAKLVNPFKGLRHEQMNEKIKNFMTTTEIDEEKYLNLIRRGAFLAQDSEAFTYPRTDGLELKPDEKRALRQEDPKTGNKWNQPWIMYALVGCCSLGAAVQGWDETAVNGAQLFYKHAFGIEKTNGNDPGIVGLVNAAPYLCCAVLGCWLTEPLNRYLGRRGTIFVTCILSSATCVWQAFTNTWWHLFIARFCLGLGVGPKSATIPIYSAECVPANIRGALVMMWQMWTAFGIMLGYIAGVIFRNVLNGDSNNCTDYDSHPTKALLLSVECSLNWRLMLASPMVLPLVAAAYVYTLPESPRWLLLKARQGKTAYYDKAFRSLCKLRHSNLQAARDLFLIHHLLDGEEDIKQGHNRFFELWSVARNRRALVASLTVMFLQQICGVNVMAFYSTEILSGVFGGKTGGDEKALLGSMGFGILNFVFALPAVYTIDTFGRRNLLLCTFPFLALFQLFSSIGSLPRFHGSATHTGLVLTGMYMFSVFYSPGEGPVPFVYSAESMPLYVRDLGMSMATATLWFFNFLLAVTFPRFQVAFTNAGAFGYYAAWCVVGWFMILFLVYETKDLTLEQLDARFSIPTNMHARWAIKDAVWVFRYYFLMRRGEKRPVLSVWTENDADVDLQRLPPRKLSMEIEQREVSHIDT